MVIIILYFLFNNSCDTDAVIPITSTRYSIDSLKLPTVGTWRAWYDDGQVINCSGTVYAMNIILKWSQIPTFILYTRNKCQVNSKRKVMVWSWNRKLCSIQGLMSLVKYMVSRPEWLSVQMLLCFHFILPFCTSGPCFCFCGFSAYFIH